MISAIAFVLFVLDKYTIKMFSLFTFLAIVFCDFDEQDISPKNAVNSNVKVHLDLMIFKRIN
jgi:hypothetical protein